MDGTRCLVCGGTDLRRFRAACGDTQTPISVVECRPCEIAWQWPLARTEAASAAYFDNRYKATDGYYSDEAVTGRVTLQLDLLESVARPSTLLDIGGGIGRFADMAAARGWTVTGIDPAAIPRNEPSLRLIRGTLADLPPQRFNAVCLWDVIEHVEDYTALLAQAVERVERGGFLVVETGNYQSLDRIIGGETWWGYQSDHRWYFSPATLRAELERHGLTVRLHESTLRPGWRKREPPSSLASIKTMLRRPGALRAHREMRRLKAEFPDWYHLPIFTLIAARA